MVSQRCLLKNEHTIPRIFNQWTALPSGEDVVDMSSAENWLMRDELHDELVSSNALASFKEHALSYADGIGGPLATRTALANLLNDFFRPKRSVIASNIVLSAGGCEALDALIQQLCDPGDGVLIATPYWSGLDISLTIQNEARIVPVDIPRHLVTDSRCVEYYNRALEVAARSFPVKVLLLCNPTNPTGECYSKQTLEAISTFCEQQDLHLVSDEVYALSAHGDDPEPPVSAISSSLSERDLRTFTSVLTLETTSPNVHVIYSLSKDFGCSGIRLGALVTQLSHQILLATALTIGPQVSTLTAHFTTATVLSRAFYHDFLRISRSRLRSAYSYTTSFLRAHEIEFIPAAAGIFIFARLGRENTEAGEKRMMEALKKERVKVVPGSHYHAAEWGWARIVFTTRRTDLVQGLERIVKAVNSLRDSQYHGKEEEKKVTASEYEDARVEADCVNVSEQGKRKRARDIEREGTTRRTRVKC